MKKYYECFECGEITSNWNEGQCPKCLTLDSLYTQEDRDYLENYEAVDSGVIEFYEF